MPNPNAKPRASRTTGTEINGWALDCSGNPHGLSHRIRRKLDDRIRRGLCAACGKEKCTCKSFRVDTKECTFFYGETQREKLQRKARPAEMQDIGGPDHFRAGGFGQNDPSNMLSQYMRHDPRVS